MKKYFLLTQFIYIKSPCLPILTLLWLVWLIKHVVLLLWRLKQVECCRLEYRIDCIKNFVSVSATMEDCLKMQTDKIKFLAYI